MIRSQGVSVVVEVKRMEDVMSLQGYEFWVGGSWDYKVTGSYSLRSDTLATSPSGINNSLIRFKN